MLLETIKKVAQLDNLVSENLKRLMKANKTMHITAQFRAILEYFAFYLCSSDNSKKAPFLAVAPAPYLPETQSEKYTLVIDILECCYAKNKRPYPTRPFAEYFIDEMSRYYEIVCFSDGMPVEINHLVSSIDPKKHIQHRLFNYHFDKVSKQ